MSDLKLNYSQVTDKTPDVIAFLTINRPKQANALSFALMQSFIEKLAEIKKKPHCRALVLKGEGKHFSAGADLSWMKLAQEMSHKDNYKEALVLSEMFELLYHLPLPTIACVKGAAYGGALGLISSCDLVIASEQSKFCLSEINLGLLPAVILPYLARRVHGGDLRRLAITGSVFSGKEAQRFGLVNHCVTEEKFEETLKSELNLLLSSAPEAIAHFKKLYHQITFQNIKQKTMTAESISQIRVGQEAQHGLSSFFAKKKPSWALSLKDDWNSHV